MDIAKYEMTERDIGRSIYRVSMLFLQSAGAKFGLDYTVHVMATNAEDAVSVAEAQHKKEWPFGIVTGCRLAKIDVL